MVTLSAHTPVQANPCQTHTPKRLLFLTQAAASQQICFLTHDKKILCQDQVTRWSEVQHPIKKNISQIPTLFHPRKNSSRARACDSVCGLANPTFRHGVAGELKTVLRQSGITTAVTASIARESGPPLTSPHSELGASLRLLGRSRPTWS